MASQFLRRNGGVLFLCLLFFTAGLLRLNSLSLYTPDSSKYLIWGNSLAHGNGFLDDSQPDPDRFVINAPLYSVLIAPVEVFFPLSILAVKVWTLLWGVVAVFVFHGFLRRYFTAGVALAGTAWLALNPALVLFGTEMLSEAPFVLFVAAALLLIDRFHPDATGQSPVDNALLLVLLATVALLREAGIAMVAAAALYFYSIRKFKRAAVILGLAAVTAGLWYYRNQIWVSSFQGPQKGNLSLMGQHFVTPADAPLSMEFATRIGHSLSVYASHLADMLFFPGASGQLSDLIVEPAAPFRFLQAALLGGGRWFAIPLVVMLLAGVAADIRKSPTAWFRLIFGSLFTLIILAYPIHDIRFLLPLSPLAIFYLLRSLQFARERWFAAIAPGRKAALAGLTAALLLIPNLIGLAELDTTNQQYVRSPEQLRKNSRFISSLYVCDWDAIHRWIVERTAPTTVLASPMKELAIAAGGRKVVDLDPGTPVSAFESMIRDNHVEYLLAVVQGDLNVYEFPMSQTRRFWFEPVCDGGNLHLLKIHSRNLDPVAPGKLFEPADTVVSIRLMKAGRDELLSGRYARAESVLVSAYRRFPRHPNIVFETMTSGLFSGDTAMAQGMYGNLMALPQTMSYTGLARMHFDAMKFLTTSSTSTMPEERAVARYKAASLYWRLGYYRRAAEVIDSLLSNHSGYFFGLLWGMHFHLQNGDTVTAREYLSRVRDIDSSNPVASSFERIFRIGDSLHRPAADSVKSGLHLELARLYLKIDLKEEAIDEAERALALAVRPDAAQEFLGLVYERKGAFRTANRYYALASAARPADRRLSAHADSIRAKSGQ